MQKFFVFLALAGCVASANANLIVNGSFEDGSFTPDANNTMSLAPGATNITGWSVLVSDIAWISDPNPFSGVTASDGIKSLDLTGYSDSTYGGVSQTFATTTGVTYNVQFDLGQNNAYGVSDIYAAINNGSLNEFSLPDASGQNWQTEDFSFVGFGSSATLSFTGNTNSGDTNYIGLDNVIVTASTPEPGSMAVLMLGTLGFIVKPLRRRATRSRVS